MPPADRTRGEPSPSRDRVPTTMQRMRTWRGPALLSFGFRPFFLIGGAYAATVVLVWLLVLTGAMASPGDWPPLAWHAHELVFGFVPAVVAGFLLTAVPNWTGRLPVVGWPLLGLVAVWLAGRLAVAAAGLLPGAFVAALATAFPVTLAVFLGRERHRARIGPPTTGRSAAPARVGRPWIDAARARAIPGRGPGSDPSPDRRRRLHGDRDPRARLLRPGRAQ